MRFFCTLFGYSKQAYYQQRRRVHGQRREDLQIVDAVHQLRRLMPRLGGRKLHYLLKDKLELEGIKLGRDRLFCVLREHGLLVPRRKHYHKTTDSRHWMRRYPNVIKDTVPVRPEQIWVADITYLTGRRRPLYLHLVTDAYSKQIMGYALSDNLAASTTLIALSMALARRQYVSQPLIHHSDRGLQYSSQLYTGQLRDHGVRISMTEDGNPYENAIAERVNGILKQEFDLDLVSGDEAMVRKLVEQSISIYNQQRPHLSCQYLTPHQMHQQSELPVRTWNRKTSEVHLDSEAKQH